MGSTVPGIDPGVLQRLTVRFGSGVKAWFDSDKRSPATRKGEMKTDDPMTTLTPRSGIFRCMSATRLVSLSWIAVVGGAGSSLFLTGSNRLAAVAVWALGVVVQLTAATYAFWASHTPRHGTVGQEPVTAK